MQTKEIIEKIHEEYAVSLPSVLGDMPIMCCQLIFEMPAKIDPKILYIQADRFYLDPTLYPDSFFFLKDQQTEACNAVTYHFGQGLDYYHAISRLLMDSAIYVQAVSDLQKAAYLGIEALLETAERYLENPIHVLDHVFSLLYTVPKQPCGNRIFDYFLTHAAPEPKYLKHVEKTVMRFHARQIRYAQIIDYNQEKMKLITCSIGRLPYLLGGIEVLQCNRAFTQTDVKIVDQLVLLLAVELAKENGRMERSGSEAEQFILDILSSNVQQQEMLRLRLQSFEHLQNRQFRLLLSQVPESKTCTLKYYFEEIGFSAPVVESFQYQNHLYFLLENQGCQKEVIQGLNHLAVKSKTLMFLSDPMDNILDSAVIVALLQAGLLLIDAAQGLFLFQDFFFKTLIHVLSSCASIPVVYFVHPGIKRLKEFDQSHQTDFLMTFKTFLQCQCSPSNTAAALHLHRNSLAYRIKKARQISNFLSDNPTACQNFLMSIQIEEYLNL